MIGAKVYTFTCDDCKAKDYYYYIESARKKGWAIARDRKHCYCPKCAPYRRNVGCRGRRKKTASIK